MCGANVTPRWEHLTRGMVSSLVKLWTRVVETGVNSVHLQRDLDLEKSAYNNFQKLRYFGLAVKDEKNSGHWLITRRGAKFLHGRQQVNRQVLIFRNHIVDRSDETVGVLDVLKCEQYWPSREDFFMDARPLDRAVQSELFG